MSLRRKITAVILTTIMLFQVCVPVFGAYVRTDGGGQIFLTDSDGTVHEVDESWEERFPFGTFAFDKSEMSLREGDGGSAGLMLYRLGGTAGRAVAYVEVTPLLARIDDDKVSYSVGAGKDDYVISVEDPLPSAYYQSVANESSYIAGDVSPSYTVENAADGETETSADKVYRLDGIVADSYQWQMYDDVTKRWLDVAGAVDASFSVPMNSNYDEYDYRCRYFAGGVYYCSVSVKGVGFVPEYVPEMPDDFVLDTTKTYTTVEMDGGEFDSYVFPVTFADGESKKVIDFSSADDVLHEAAEYLTVRIIDAEGAVLYDAANTCALMIEDDEAPLPSVMGFEMSDVEIDKASQTARIKLVREGALQYLTSVDYATSDDTAAAGKDYVASSGTAYFPIDLDFTFIEIPLIDDSVGVSADKSALRFDVTLSNPQGGGADSSVGLGDVSVKLYNSATAVVKNAASVLYAGGENDISANVETSSPVISADDEIEINAVERVSGLSEPAEYVPIGSETVINPRARVKLYSELSFGSTVSSTDFWRPKAMVGNHDNDPKGDNHENFISGDGNNWTELAYEKGRYEAYQLTIDNLYKRYTGIENGKIGVTNVFDFFGMAQYVSFIGVIDNSEGNIMKQWALTDDDNYKDNKEYIYKLSNYGFTGAEGGITYSIMSFTKYAPSIRFYNLGLTRRALIENPILRIHTADDARIAAEQPDFYNTIKPTVTMVKGGAGTNANGKLYVNSKLEVELPTGGGYEYSLVKREYALGSNITSLGGALAFTPANNNNYNWAIPVAGEKSAQINLIDKYYSRAIDATTYLDVYMDRVQKVTLDIAPSVPRITDEHGNALAEIDTSKIAATWDKFSNNVSIKYKEAFNYYVFPLFEDYEINGFRDQNLALKKTDFAASSGDTKYAVTTKIRNLQSINFHMPADDIILFNGKMYAGNETIVIPIDQFQMDNLTFRYYASEYIGKDNVMTTDISRILRYADMNANNKVDAGDLQLSDLNGDAYCIDLLAPLSDGESEQRYQQILQIYYTMTPRNLFLPAEREGMDNFAQVIPAITTNITDPALYSELSAEMQGYRYIDSEGTGLNKPMYTPSASLETFVTLPLGGDFSPAVVKKTTSGDASVTWTPQWKGHLLSEFAPTDPEPVFMNNTYIGDMVPVGEVYTDPDSGENAGKLKGGAELDKVLSYLGSMHENDTFALVVREQPIADEMTTFGLMAAVANDIPGAESSTNGGVMTTPPVGPSAGGSGPKNAGADFNTAHGNSPYKELDIAGDVNLPSMSFGLTDYISVAIDGQEIAMSIGVPIVGVAGKSDHNGADWASGWQTDGDNTGGPAQQNKAAVEGAKQLYDALFGSGDDSEALGEEWNKQRTNMRNAQNADKGVSASSKSASFGFGVSVVLKYNPIECTYLFQSLTFMASGAVEISYTYRFAFCPLVFVYLHAGLSADIAAGLNANYIKIADEAKIAELDGTGEVHEYLDTALPDEGKYAYYKNSAGKSWEYAANQENMGRDGLDAPENDDFIVGEKGMSVAYYTREKAIDIVFSGTLLVTSNAPDFEGGTVKSNGAEAVTIKLKSEINGTPFSQPYWVKFTVVADKVTRSYSKDGTLTELTGGAIIDRIVPIKRLESDIYFSGLSFSPEIFLEASAGVGIELLKAEVYLKVSVGATMSLGSYNSDEYGEGDYNKATLDEFTFTAALGIRVTALFFSYEFEAVQFCISYDRETVFDEKQGKQTGWNFFWYFGGKPKEARRRGVQTSSTADPLQVKIKMPGTYTNEEILHIAEQNSFMMPFSIMPTDEKVPFELSSYGTSGDAYTLGEDLIPGASYKLVTANGKNYIVYTITNKDREGIHTSQIVMSEVVGTGTNIGLAHPAGGDGIAYAVIDDDVYGDLDFDVWVDGETVRVAWVSYNSSAAAAGEAAREGVPSDDENGAVIAYMAAAAQEVEVKTATFNADSGFTAPVVADDGTDKGYLSLPRGAGDMIAYSESVYYEAGELEELLSAYELFFVAPEILTDSGYNYGLGDPSANFQYEQKRMNKTVYGKSSRINFAVLDGDSYVPSSYNNETWDENGVQIENFSITKDTDGAFYLAYSTSRNELTENDERTIKRLYLQKVTLPETGAVPNVTSAAILRTTFDSSNNNAEDGVYSGGVKVSAYNDPYFSNIRFLDGDIGALKGESEDFGEEVTFTPAALLGDGEITKENFLIFEMNGNNYIVPNESLKSMTAASATDRKGEIIPFFAADDNGFLTGGSHFTLGADGKGNLSAVYVKSVPNTSNTALYLSKYDAATNTWGVGTMLAMNNMSVYEKTQTEYMTDAEIEAAYYDVTAGGDLQSFAFGKMQIALGSSDENNESLLVITEGQLSALEAKAAMIPTMSRNEVTKTYDFVGIEDSGHSAYSVKEKADGGYDIKNGIYAVNFGVGEQVIGNASINLMDYAFTPENVLTASVSFTNTGDVGIRGSESEPITVSLMLAPQGGGETKVLASWTVEDTIRAGSSVVMPYTATAALPGEDLSAYKLYFAVSEQSGGTFTTLSDTDTAACITIGDKAELAFESSDMRIVGIEDDNIIVSADLHIGNRGINTAENTYLHVEYTKTTDDDANGDGIKDIVSHNVDLRGHNLNVSVQSPLLRMFSLDDKTPENGYLSLAAQGEGSDTAGKIGTMSGRTVTGTFKVPKSYFDANSGTGSLNLRLTIVSATDEYTTDNNVSYKSLEPLTTFTAAENIAMAKGSTIRLSVKIQTSGTAKPVITATDISDTNTRNLGVLYYDDALRAVVIMPTSEGTGKIRIADILTNSFIDVCYTVAGEGVGINIFDDNDIFKWYNAKGEGGSKGKDDWIFSNTGSKVLPNGSQKPTYMGNLAKGKQNAVFTFDTLAGSIDLYFEGTVYVTSDLPGVEGKTFSSTDLTSPTRIDFGGNDDHVSHTVTVKVTSQNADFDFFTETFAPFTDIKSDAAAPNIYWSRTFPKAATVKSGENVQISAYFVDLGGIVSVTHNGAIVLAENLIQSGAELWEYPITFSENGSHTFVATDSSGHTTSRTVSVDWFNSNEGFVTTDTAPALDSKLIDGGGNHITGEQVIAGDTSVYITGPSGAIVRKLDYIDEGGTIQTFAAVSIAENGGKYPINDGVYSITVSDGDASSTRIFNMNLRDPNAPTASLVRVGDNLRYSAAKVKSAKSNMITGVELSGIGSIPFIPGYSIEGTMLARFNGEYVLTVKDALFTITSDVVKITDKGITIMDGAVTVTPDSGSRPTPNTDGTIALDISKVTGGKWDAAKTAADKEYGAVYEISFDNETWVSPAQYETPSDEGAPTVYTGARRENLAAGEYVVYVRDANDTSDVAEVTVTVAFYTVSFTSSAKVTSTPDAANGSITITAFDGSGSYMYKLNDEIPLETPVFENLTAGDYVITVTDKFHSDSVATATVTVEATPWVEFTFTTEVTSTPIAANGSITVTADGGTGEYFYQINDEPPRETPVFANLTAGEYVITVIDKTYDDNRVSETVTVEATPWVRFRAETASASSTAFSDGSIRVTASGGTGEYLYQLGSKAAQTSPIFKLLPMGAYKITVIDKTYSDNRHTMTVRIGAFPPVGGQIQEAAPIEPTVTETDVETAGAGYEMILGDDGDYTVTISGVTDIEYAFSVSETNGRGLTIVTYFGSVTFSAGALKSLESMYGDVITIVIRRGSFIVAVLVNGVEVAYNDGENPLVISLPVSDGGKAEAEFADSENSAADSDIGGSDEENGYVAVIRRGGKDTVIPTGVEKNGNIKLKSPTTGEFDVVRNKKEFNDTQTHWALGHITFTSARNLFSGTSDTEFSPNMNMTRAMFATVLSRLDGVDLSAYSVSRFSDVPSGMWYSAAVEWAADKGIVTGYDGVFNPDNNVTREQMAVMLDKYIKYKGYTLPTANAVEFSDGDTIAGWALDGVKSIQRAGIINGKPGGFFDPQGTATRAEVATVFAKFIRLIAE